MLVETEVETELLPIKKFNSYTLEVVYVIENEQTIIITLYYL